MFKVTLLFVSAIYVRSLLSETLLLGVYQLRECAPKISEI